MKKGLLLITTVLFGFTTFAQSWTKISTNLDSLWTSTVTYYNLGDTLIMHGSTQGPGALDPKRFYVSTDGGYNFTRDFTNLDALTFTPIQSLPINNMIIGFKNSPNSGSYAFQSLGNWNSIIPFELGYFAEVNSGTLVWGPGTGNLYTLTPTGANLTLVASGANGINLRSSFNDGNRLFLGSSSNNAIKYVDNGNFGAIQTANIPSQGATAVVTRFFKAANVLYAVVNAGQEKLFKSTDSGANWTEQNTTWDNDGNTDDLLAAFIIGTPNGNIYFLETGFGTSDNVFLSTDGGATATKISNGLPVDGIHIGPTVGKLLTNGNKVWYQVKAANTTDFVRTDTAIAGLFVLNLESAGIQNEELQEKSISLFPNPSKSILNVAGGDQITEIKVFTSLGKEVNLVSSKQNSLDISHLPAGIYYAQINQKNQEKVFLKFVKD